MKQLPKYDVVTLVIKEVLNKITLDNNTALSVKGYYPTWDEVLNQFEKQNKKLDKGFKFTYSNDLYETIQSFIPNSIYPPSLDTASLYKVINETFSGEIDDAIPFKPPMTLENGKYYTDGEQMYKCNRDSGNPMTHELKELIGTYVEVI